jgi:hypothetical protein
LCTTLPWLVRKPLRKTPATQAIGRAMRPLYPTAAQIAAATQTISATTSTPREGMWGNSLAHDRGRNSEASCWERSR